MTQLYDQLSQDHRNLVKVLDILEKQIALYDTREDAGTEKPDSTLIMDILDYVHYYPEAFHHPLEEAAFDYLTEQGKGDLDEIAAIQKEHKTLESQSAEVRAMVQAIHVGEPVPVERLHSELDYFHQQQLAHLEREEETIFRDIEALDKQASDEILERVSQRPDPLFSGQAGDQFRELIEELN